MRAGPDDEAPLKPLKEINPAADEDHARKKPRVSPCIESFPFNWPHRALLLVNLAHLDAIEKVESKCCSLLQCHLQGLR